MFEDTLAEFGISYVWLERGLESMSCRFVLHLRKHTCAYAVEPCFTSYFCCIFVLLLILTI